jgi:serine/threonine-protein kinase
MSVLYLYPSGAPTMTGASTTVHSHPRGCLDETTVLDLLAGYLEPSVRAEAESHMATCDGCRRLVSVLARGARSPHADSRPAAFASTEPDPSQIGDDSSPRVQGAPELVAGKYRPVRLIGEGGMGFVVEAEHVVLERSVAIKLMKPATIRVPGAASRFLREARAAVSIEGEHVARVLDVGSVDARDAVVLREVLDDVAEGTPYMVMELLRGEDLATLLRARGRLPIDEAIDYVLQACEAIAEAHRLGIVHRDLKPANLFLTARPDGTPLVRVLDFGISKMRAPDDGCTTTAGSALGSPRYMSPELIRDAKTVDARADVWALGCILYELVSGLPAFDSDSIAGLAARIATDPAPRVRAAVPTVPAALERVIVACLEKEPARRISCVAELARSLAPMAPAHAHLSIERIARIAPEAGLAAADRQRAQRSTAGRRALVGLVAAGCFAAAAGYVMLGRTPANRVDPVAETTSAVVPSLPTAAAALPLVTAAAPTVAPTDETPVASVSPEPHGPTSRPAPAQAPSQKPARAAPITHASIALPAETAPPVASTPTDEMDLHGLRDRK